jgi:hypothetical protein
VICEKNSERTATILARHSPVPVFCSFTARTRFDPEYEFTAVANVVNGPLAAGFLFSVSKTETEGG